MWGANIDSHFETSGTVTLRTQGQSLFAPRYVLSLHPNPPCCRLEVAGRGEGGGKCVWGGGAEAGETFHFEG